MFSILQIVFIFFHFNFLVFSYDLYGPHPRIVSNNGNLVIYAADHKNISLKTTNRGYINLNDENLILLLKKANNASVTMDRITTNIIEPLSSSMKSVTDLIYGSEGLLRRVSNLENNVTTISPSQPFPMRNRNWLQLNRRVRILETKMIRVLNLLTTNECESNPCKNGGECFDLYNGYFCRCSDSWTGSSCETDVNECTRFHGTDLGCQNGATCINKQGSYECICATGWYGLHCNRRSKDCNSGSAHELCGHGTCVSQNTPTGYTCICDQGWTTNGITPACTVDVNECDTSKTPVCSTNPPVPCINVPGTFYCGSCPTGYSGNGFYCNDIDECLINNGGCSLSPRVQCINTMGSRMCGSCPPGYLGDGIMCSFQGICQVNNGGCHPQARCISNPHIGNNYVQCICPAGYVGTGMGPHGCIQDTAGPVITACSSNPCVHGTCSSNSNSTFVCDCQVGFTGKLCDSMVNPCDSNPCKNGATCLNNGHKYTCECTTAYTGFNCENERQACGGKLTETQGYLQIPPANNTNYNMGVSCSWVIQTLPDKILNVTFTKFHLESPSSTNMCVYDWLQIHDGPNSASHMIGRFCGTALPKGGQIVSTHNSLYVWFRTDRTNSFPGFALKWTTGDPICGGNIAVETYGLINSPGSPGNYPTNRDCQWTLVAPYGKRIQFRFFTINIGNNPNCSYDYLSVYSGSVEDNSLLAQFCNSSTPEPLIVPGSIASLLFHSDGSGTYSGFQISYDVVEGIPGCGGLFTADRGEFSSPLLDEQYHSNSDCDYKIKVGKNTRIKITFLSFALEESINCQFDYVSVHEGGGPDSPLVGRYCGSVIPPSYTSLSNELFIRFKTDTYINDDGFRIKYETICENTYVAPSGIIQSPGYPLSSASIRNCLYIIKQKPGTAIKFTFKDISIGKENCNVDYLEVRDGDNENSTLIGKYCGWTTPGEIISTHNYLRIKMVTLSGRNNIGFLANYSTIDLSCGGIIKDPVGIIKNPVSANTYPSNARCTWIISAPPGYIIQLTWVVFHTEWSSTCVADYVAVYENNTATGYNALIGRYCGKTLPPMIFSSTNLVTLMFVSDYSDTYEGFIVNYNFRDESTACGGHYFVPTGIIKSPSYPMKYPPNKDCVWIITVPHGQQIMLHVEDFDIEIYLNCASDYLEIRNGAHVTSPLIGTFCGKNIPKSIPSHTNNLYIKFHTDNYNSKKGFKFTWDGTLQGCGGTLVSPTGQVVSPNYPQPYGQNALCLWKISTSAGSVLRLIFLDLALEPQILCRLDYVEVYDGLDVSSKSLGRYCSDFDPISLSTSGNRALIKFRSDVSHEGRGFLLRYITLCNNTLQGYGGVIESLNFPNPYPRNQNCTWKIKVPQGNKINITFSHFDLENTTKYQTECKFDYVEIKEGHSYEQEDILLKKSCGVLLPPHIQSNTNEVAVNFVSDSIVHNSGFRLEWEVVGCSAFLTKPNGKISTPGYPNWYPTSTTCEWIIQVDFDSAVELTVGKFDFETSAQCYYDSLKVYNGPDENSPLISTICHSDEKGLTITSTSRTMFVKFTSDSLYSGKGFEANYKTVPSQCGGKYTAPSGSVFSRNYPQNYKNNDDCEWLIEIHPNHVIELEFHEFDLVTTRNCTTDYLEIYDGNSTSYPLIQKLCGGQQPNETIKSSANTLYLKFITGSRITAKGFLANYTTGCGSRIVTSTNGILDISDWKYGECEWTIIADQLDKHVTLTITHLDVSTNSEDPPLYIYDGTDSESPLIGGYSGTKAPAMIVSNGAALHIKLNYAYGASIRGTYSVIDTECGGTMTSLSGYFGSVGYPNNYPLNTECQWIINVAPGNKVSLVFLDFDLISSVNCNADYVEIRENNAAGKLLGVFCGNTIPSNISQSNSLWVQFKSTDIGTSKGFLVEYMLSHGNELFGSKGEIASPLYPMKFDAYDIITWRITVEFKGVILITFKDFSVDWYSGEDCEYWTGLEIYDGYDDTSPSLATLCTSNSPTEIRSTSNIVFIKLYKALFSYKIKFLLEWRQVQPVTSNILKNITMETCGSDNIIDISSLSSYELKSPGFPYGYAPNLNCEWIFSVQPEKHISIAFTSLDLEGTNPRCVLDNVKIYTGEEGKPKWRLVDTVCLSNSTLMNAIHTSNLMKVVFKTDAYVNKTGFSAVVTPECGGSLVGPNGIIEIENYTRRGYFRKTDCEWNITVKAGRTIQIKFLKFNITNNDENTCNNNYILLKNGRYPDSPYLGAGKYCGTTIPVLNETSGNSLYIKYRMSRRDQGFKLSYTEKSLLCGQNIKLTHTFNATNISSPNYPNIPPAHSECIWIISVPPGETVQIDFIERFDIESTVNCEKEGVELRDGGTSRSRLIDTFCDKIPSTQKTSDNLLYIRFYTDVPDPRNGFKATISIASCGGTIRAKYGKLASPFYPHLYTFPVNTVCTWTIIGPTQHFLNISFTDFRFPFRANCADSSHVLVTEILPSGNETTLATLCGLRKPSDIQTSTNTVKIQMKILLNARSIKGFSLTFNSSLETCGGTIEADSGIITSPDYPATRSYRTCRWIIIVPEGRRVSINLIDYDLDTSLQGLSFYQSTEYRAFLANKNNNGSIIKSSSNIMMIYYWVYIDMNHRGFKLEFKSDEPTICIGDINQDSGIITTPNENMSSYFCEWIRRPKENENVFTNRTLVLTIDIRNLSNIYRRSCKYAMSAISVSTETDSDLNIQLCSYISEPKIIRNPYPTTRLTVVQGRYDRQMNYTINYKVNPCGGMLTLSSGTISSPNFPNQQSNSIDCAWFIKTDGLPIKVNFTSLDLDKTCTKNYIEIYNGPSPSSPKIGRYCGSTIPNFIQSQSDSLWIEYHASIGAQGKGFSLTYDTNDLGCGGIFHDNKRLINTPNYPSSYPNNIECIWEVQSESGFHIGLYFVDRFHIENSTNCTNDYVEILDYDDENWISLGRYCGRVQPTAFNSTTNRLRIVFHSNEKLQASGFKASWNFNCGGTYLAKETPKYLVSPGYPIAYNKNLDCKYSIIAPGKYVNIIFEDFLLEEGRHFSTNCVFDNVTIGRPRLFGMPWGYARARNNKTDFIYVNTGVYCGSKIPPPLRWQDQIRLWFRSDKWVDKKGFKLRYFIDSCGGPITNETEISSPVDLSGKNTYYTSINCVWNITAPKNKIVIVQFTFFEFEYNQKCAYDNVALYNGNSIKRLALLCGNMTSNLPVIRSTDNNMLVVMKTDSFNSFRGFKANVLFMYNEKVGCGGFLNLTNDEAQQNLRSPDIDGSGQYSSNLDCHWLIEAPREETIELNFNSFHFVPCNTSVLTEKCTCDYLQIRDGAGPLSELIAQPCGHDKPTKIISSGNRLWIRMVTDGVESSSGFRATVKKVPSICGKSLYQATNEKQILVSPGFPENYPNNIRCTWVIETNNTYSKLEINFDHFELEDSEREDSCTKDKLEINNKFSLNHLNEELGERLVFSGSTTSHIMTSYSLPTSSFLLCGSGQPPVFYSERNQVIISFKSDSIGTKKGFQLDYRVAGCNRNYTAMQGRIMNERIVTDCIITISAPINYTISLYFQAFLINDYQNCATSGLLIHDGNSSAAPELAKYCGFLIPNPVFSHSNELWIKVKSNGKGYKMYDIIYTTTDQGRGCGGDIYNYVGSLTSPMYPNNYRNNSVCRWNLSVPRRLKIFLKFSVFDLGPIHTCQTDYVELIDIDSSTKQETVRSRYCSRDKPAEFLASSNLMALRYVVSANNAGAGWTAQFNGKEFA